MQIEIGDVFVRNRPCLKPPLIWNDAIFDKLIIVAFNGPWLTVMCSGATDISHSRVLMAARFLMNYWTKT